ncbi:MAG: urea carboxylase-associated family protein [Pseudomonadota bacterium]
MVQPGEIRERLTIPARHGLAVPLAKGASLRVINTTGTQVVDTWAFPDGDPAAFLSMEHCREVLQRIVFEPGDTLIDNRYRPLLTMTADTSPGGHDTLIAACSRAMYIHAGAGDDHANCADNLAGVLAPHDRSFSFTPSPWNLFMLAPVADGRTIDYVRPTSEPGAYVEVMAEADCVMAFSACPDDVYPTNGDDGTPQDAHVEVLM